MISRDLFLAFIKLHILHHADEDAIYGLWLIEELAQHGYRLSPGTLYPILHGMEQEGLLKSESRVVNGKARKYYRTTASGRSELQEGKARAKELLGEIDA